MMLSSEDRIMSIEQLLQIVSKSKVITENEDVLIEILLQTPVKCLLRAKCVSQQFRRIISDPLFGYEYYRNNPCATNIYSLLLYRLSSRSNPACNFIFLTRDRLGNPFWSLPFTNASSDIYSISSCKGLMCVCTISYVASGVSDVYDYYICNPTTNKFIKLPEPNRYHESRIVATSIAFKPKSSPFYKVVCVWVRKNLYRFSIYSSKTRIWRNTGSSLEVKPDDNYIFTSGVFWNDSVHWVGDSGPFLRFDINEECLANVPVTQVSFHKRPRKIQYFGESNDHLVLVEGHGYQTLRFEIFQLKRDYSEWINVCYVDGSRLFPLSGEERILGRYSVQLVIAPDEGQSLWSVVLSTSRATYFFSACGRPCFSWVRSRLYENTGDVDRYKWYNSHQFIMTLTAV